MCVCVCVCACVCVCVCNFVFAGSQLCLHDQMIPTKWLKGNRYGIHDAAISGIHHVHHTHKLKNFDGQTFRMSEINPYELIHLIELYSHPGAVVTTCLSVASSSDKCAAYRSWTTLLGRSPSSTPLRGLAGYASGQ